MKGKIHIGTSGWHYKHWLGTWYPQETRAAEQFAWYAKHLRTVEINNSFYRLPTAKTFTDWREAAPRNFLFAVKASRYITHMRKLKDPAQTIAAFMDNVALLKQKLGPILFQLPPSWKINVERLAEFLEALPAQHRYVFEFRNPTWYDDAIYDLLNRYNCAFCIYELAGHLSPPEITADFVYVRLHGPGEKYQGSYSDRALRSWAKKCRACADEGKDVFVYFDNDQTGYAAFNAERLVELLN